jgi:hypothetical protein
LIFLILFTKWFKIKTFYYSSNFNFIIMEIIYNSSLNSSWLFHHSN